MEITSVSLKDYSSLRIGGEGRVCFVTTPEGIREAYLYAKENNLIAHILGDGTNTYFGADLSRFLFVKMNIKGVEFKDEGDTVLVTARGGEVWDEVVQKSAEQNLWGIENLSLIPGTVGAAPVQNIGAYGVELKDVFVALEAFDTETLQMVVMEGDVCEFGYRDSVFKRNPRRYIITQVTLRLQKSPHPVLTYKPLDSLTGVEDLTPAMVRDTVIKTRKAKLPDWKEVANNGSFFKNPIVTASAARELEVKFPGIVLHATDEGYKVPAAWLIDNIAQMKGERVGDVGTWPNQPLVIINHGGATADDIDAFALTIRTKVEQATGIVLEQEVNRVG